MRHKLETPSGYPAVDTADRRPPSKEEISPSSQCPDDRLAQIVYSKEITSRPNPIEKKKQPKKTKISTPSTQKNNLPDPGADNSLAEQARKRTIPVLLTFHKSLTHNIHHVSLSLSASDPIRPYRWHIT